MPSAPDFIALVALACVLWFGYHDMHKDERTFKRMYKDGSTWK